MTQLLPVSEVGQKLPPFQSATDFPIRPKQERLAQLYPDILQALKNANAARGILRISLEKKKQIIIEVRAEIQRLEMDLALEANARMQLHAMNEQLLKALQEIERVADDAADVVINAHQIPRTGLGALIEKLKNLVKRWRALKLQHQSELVLPVSESGDD